MNFSRFLSQHLQTWLEGNRNSIQNDKPGILTTLPYCYVLVIGMSERPPLSSCPTYTPRLKKILFKSHCMYPITAWICLPSLLPSTLSCRDLQWSMDYAADWEYIAATSRLNFKATVLTSHLVLPSLCLYVL